MNLPIDAVDKKILANLIKNSRIPLTLLAKSAGISREVVTYRLNRLKEKGIILGFVTEININKLGFLEAAVFVTTKTNRENEFKNYLLTSDYISWVGEHVGIWDYGMSIFGKTAEEIDANFLEFYQKFKDIMIDHRLTLNKKNSFFYEKLFGVEYRNHKKTTLAYKADETDKRILSLLSLNARVDYVELSSKIKLTAPAIKDRIKKLESTGYIERYTTFLDFSKLNLYQYSIFIVNKNIQDRQNLLSYLARHPDICYTVEYLGDPFIEFGVLINNPYDLRKILRDMDNLFPENRILEISLQKEVVSINPAKCVFE